MIRVLIIVLTVLGVAGPALAGGPISGIAETLTTPIQLDEAPAMAPPDAATVEVRTLHLASIMRCPVCQGLSVADSNSEAAVNMHTRIQELVEQGYSDDQIVGYFVTRYGEWIMLEPKAEGLSWLIFLGPGVVVLIGCGVIAKRLAGNDDVVEASVDVDEAGADEADAAEAGAAEDNADEPTAPIQAAPVADPAADPYRDRILAELGDSTTRKAGEGA